MPSTLLVRPVSPQSSRWFRPGIGITLLPEMCLGVEARGRELTIIRFAEPEPSRSIGLVWRTTSPRKDDFRELGRLVSKAWNEGPLASVRSSGVKSKKPAAATSDGPS